jgi:hypothetical protein
MAPAKKSKSQKQQRRNVGGGGGQPSSTTASTTATTPQPRKLSVAQLMAAAEQAVAVDDDPRHAIALYAVALHKCQNNGNNGSNGSNGGTGTINGGSTSSTPRVTGQKGDSLLLQQCDLWERRAEVHVSLQNVPAATTDYQAALDALQSILSNATPTESDDDVDVDKGQLWQRAAGLCMYLGQLSTAHDALAWYQRGCHGLIEAFATAAARDHNGAMDDDNNNVDDNNTAWNAELSAQYATACCSIAELYLTDLCLEDGAEQQCEGYLQTALDPRALYRHDDDTLPNAAAMSHIATESNSSRSSSSSSSSSSSTCIEAWQLLASLRLSQQRNVEAATIIMTKVYAPTLALPCRAVAALVGLESLLPTAAAAAAAATATRTNTSDANHASMATATATATTMATELTEAEMEQVQALPDFAFRCQTSKLLLECAHHCAAAAAGGAASAVVASATVERPTMDTQRPVAALDCAQAAVAVLGSLVAENDEVVEIWSLLGDAVSLVDQQQSAALPGQPSPSLGRIYWERALEMLLVVQENLEEEIRHGSYMSNQDASSIEDSEDALQLQLDDVLGRIEDLRAKLGETSSDDDDEMST